MALQAGFHETSRAKPNQPNGGAADHAGPGNVNGHLKRNDSIGYLSTEAAGRCNGSRSSTDSPEFLQDVCDRWYPSQVQRVSVEFLKWCCVRCSSIVSVLRTIDGSQHSPNLKKQAGEPAWDQSNSAVDRGSSNA